MISSKNIKACIDGNSRSQKLLYDTYSSQMYSICLRYCKDEMSAADALQNGFIKVFRYLGKFKGDADLFFWIRKIIIRSAIDQYKTDNKRRVDDLDEVETSDTSYHQTIDFDLHNYNEMMGLISRLPNGYKNVFSMYVLDDMSYKEISDLLEISESTCRTQLFKARKLLQKMILTEKPEIVKEYNLIKKIG